MNQQVKNNKDQKKNNDNNNSSNSLAFGRWPQTKIGIPQTPNMLRLEIIGAAAGQEGDFCVSLIQVLSWPSVA